MSTRSAAGLSCDSLIESREGYRPLEAKSPPLCHATERSRCASPPASPGGKLTGVLLVPGRRGRMTGAMRRLLRILLNAATVLSLLLCVATVGLWILGSFGSDDSNIAAPLK